MIVFSLIFILCSCREVTSDPHQIVSAMAESCEIRSVGSVYTTESSQGSPDHLSSELLFELFGDFDFSGVKGAVCLADGVELFELSAFDCPDPDTAEAVGGLCAVRFDHAVKAAKKMNISEVDFTVKIYGNRVLAALCEDSDTAIGAGMEKIKGGKSLLNMKKG